MPPKIGSLPIHLPYAFGLYIRCLRDSFLDLTFGLIRQLPDLEYFDALATHATTEIDLIAKVGRWAATFDKLPCHHLILLRFKLTERHALDYT